jgi:hypothetical protein
MTRRSIFLKNESYNDVMSALAKAKTDEERRHMISERLKANGWNKEKEISFRENCRSVGFILPGAPKPMAQNSGTRTTPGVLATAAGLERSYGKIE